MTDESGFAGLTTADRRRIDTACDEFERAWQRETPPAVQAFTADFAEPALSCLIQELIQVDIAYRRRLDSDAASGAYRVQFPQHGRVIDEALAATVHPDETVSAEAAEASAGQPRQIGPYRILEELGRGGMGVVYKARQQNPDRLVALKVLNPGLDAGEQGRERFRRETAALARLKHPGIVPLYEAGQNDGFYFYSMEWVEGPSLRNRIEDRPLLPREAAEVVAKLARIVHYAHEQGVLHRDLKPANVLLGRDGEPRLTDFGLAKLAWEATGLTDEGQRLGTPSYMAPEQASPQRGTVAETSDVYGLGAVLYCCLSGHPPFRSAVAAETYRQVLEDDPPPLRGIDRDLQTICLKCLEKQPASRYGTALELAEDLGRFLQGEPILARPVRPVVHALRWCRKRKLRVSAALLFLVLLAVGPPVGVGYWQMQVAQEQQERLRRLAETKNLRFNQRDLQLAVRTGDLGAAAFARREISDAYSSWDTQWLENQVGSVWDRQATLVEGHWGFVDAVLDQDRNLLVTADSSGMLLAWNLQDGTILRRFHEGRWNDEVRRWLHYFEARSEPDRWTWGPCYTALQRLTGKSEVVAASLDGTVLRIDLERLEVVELLRAKQAWLAIASAADGMGVVVASEDGTLTLLSRDGQVTATRERTGAAVVELCALPGAEGWIAARSDGTLDWVSGPDLALHSLTNLQVPVWSVDAARQGERILIAVGADKPDVPIFEISPTTRRMQPADLLFPPPAADAVLRFQRVRFSADGQRLHGFDDRGRIWCWQLGAGRMLWSLQATAPDLRKNELLKGIQERKLGEQLPVPLRRVGTVIVENAAAHRLITAGDDMAIKLWTRRGAGKDAVSRLPVKLGPQPQVGFDRAHPAWLWSLNADGWLRAVDVLTARIVAEHRAHQGGATDLHVLDNPSVILTAGGDPALGLWQWQGDKVVAAPGPTFRSEAGLLSAAASPDGRWLAAVDVAARLIVWDRQTGQMELRKNLTPDGAIRERILGESIRPLTGRVAFSPDSRRLCAFGSGVTSRLFSVPAFRELPEQPWIAGNGGTAMIWGAADPHLLLVADDYPRYEARNLRPDSVWTGELGIPKSPCVALAHTADSRRTVALEQNGDILFMDSEFFMPVLRMSSDIASASDLAFDSKGRRLAIAAQTGEVGIWDPAQASIATALPPLAETVEWTLRWLAEPTHLTLRTQAPMIRIDRHGLVQMLYTESMPSDYRAEGALYWVGEKLGAASRERVETGEAEWARRASSESATLEIAPDNQPVIAFRLRTAELSPYDGKMLMGRRTSSQDWRFQTIHAHGNMGFYPVLQLDPDGVPQQLAHFTFAGFYLLLSSRGGIDAEWTVQDLGQQGDGMHLAGAWDREGHLHAVFRTNRTNSDPAPPLYAEWNGSELVRPWIDPYLPIAAFDAPLLSAGAPVVRMGQALMRRTKTGWEKHCTLPTAPEMNVALDGKGQACFLTLDRFERRFRVWQGAGDRWSVHPLSTLLPDLPTGWRVLLDGDEQPVIVAWHSEVPSWIAVLRPQ